MYISARTPKWRTRTSVELFVLFENHDSEIPFVAHEDDTDEYNRELFTRAVNGDFGPIDLARKGIADIISKSITTKRDVLLLTGGAKVGEHWFHSDTHSKVQQLSLMIAGAALPANLMWKTMSGEKILMTPVLAVQIYQTQMYQESVLFNHAESLLAQIYEMEFPETLDIENGWPEVYK
jgi:hypothetical protein